MPRYILLACALTLASCDSGTTATSPAPELCADRTGGALITFQIVQETFTGWFTDSDFIAAAQAHLTNGTTQVPNFAHVIAGPDCDATWNFHVAPDDAEFADFTIELCSAIPSHINNNRDEWISTVGSWCPWSAVVTTVERR
jgi:hypothetical protein